MSTTPVREALRQLVSECLLDSDPHRGVVVHETSLDELEQIYEIRLVLEPLSIKATVENNIRLEELARAEGLAGAMEEEENTARWTELERRFHLVLSGAARRPLLASILNNRRYLSALYIARSLQHVADRVAAAKAEHRSLVEAIRNSGVDTAVEVERAHLEHALEIEMIALADHD